MTRNGAAAGYEVLAVRYGTRVTTKAESYLNFHMYGEPDESFEMDYYFWLVHGAGRTVVIDCGFGAEPGARRGRQMLVDPVEALADLGVDAAAVDQLVVTHAHYDHIGNLHRFPNAEIVIARREFEFWTGPYARRFQLAQPTEPAELACLGQAGAQGRLRLVDGALDLALGIELVVVGGHTPGQMVARVGSTVLAADAVHFYEELERDRPFFIVADLPDMYRGFDVVREMCEEPGAVLVAGHDADVRRRFPERAGEFVIRVSGKEAG